MKKILIVLLLVVAVGCTKKYTKTPGSEDMPYLQVKEQMMKDKMAEPEEIVEEMVVAQEERIYEQELSAEEKARSIFRDILFDYDKYNIRPEARPALDSVAAFLKEESRVNIVIEGHCDERGTNEYNLALGEKRAKAARDYLAARGVSSARMLILTYGEEKPLCMDHNESCWQNNRRAHFVLTR